jgi:hypothetical protein
LTVIEWIDKVIKKNISYPERWRDWPYETSATGLLK